jgi:hypothetical protein
MKLYADKHRSERVFQEGELVLLKLQPYVQNSVVSCSCPKLAYKYFGPYEIVKKVGSMAYKLKLSDGSLIHPVFHVSQLKPFTPDYTLVYHMLPEIPALDIVEVLLVKVLESRLVKKGNMAITQVLVQWSGLLVTSATWEHYLMLWNNFLAAAA